MGLFENEAVMRIIVEPMQVRWAKPRNVQSIDAVMGDYIDDLSKFSENDLKIAFTEVRQSHEYASWPSSATFLKAVKLIGGSGQANDNSRSGIAQDRDRAMRAQQYAAWYLDNTDLGKQSWHEGWFISLRRYLVKEAAKQLNSGAEQPHVTVTDHQIAEWQRPWVMDAA